MRKYSCYVMNQFLFHTLPIDVYKGTAKFSEEIINKTLGRKLIYYIFVASIYFAVVLYTPMSFLLITYYCIAVTDNIMW